MLSGLSHKRKNQSCYDVNPEVKKAAVRARYQAMKRRKLLGLFTRHVLARRMLHGAVYVANSAKRKAVAKTAKSNKRKAQFKLYLYV